MLGRSKYSEKELEMFAHFGMAEFAEYTAASLFYTMLASKAFVMNDQTPWSNALRRCLVALEAGGYRGTPEWDALIGDCDQPSTNDPEDFDDFGGK